MVLTMERIMHVKESGTIPRARVIIRMQLAGIVLNMETKTLTNKLTAMASSAVTMKVTDAPEVAMVVEVHVAARTF